MPIPLVALFIISMALFFEFINGFHDTANAVATSIATKSLEPFQAIGLSATFNLIGALSGTAVAITIARDFADPAMATHLVIISALLAAITWNLITWVFGIPSSSSHALIGGLIGAIAFNSGVKYVRFAGILHKVVIPMALSPILGFFIAAFIAIGLSRLLQNNKQPRKTNNKIRELQVLSTAFLSFSHGANDAQKTMGIITLTLFNFHIIDTLAVPSLVIFVCAICMASGAMAGGVRIIKTLSTRVAKLQPASGFAAEISSATLLFIGAKLGIPLSTTHAVSCSIMGAGITNRFGLNWGVIKNMVIAWILTLPVCALIAGIFLHILKMFG
ncbi:MAG: inorganic phosphate transporter [Burkholderiales bacterium]|nr:inorganic phosphate transporter [Burkholderiales bacterium]